MHKKNAWHNETGRVETARIRGAGGGWTAEERRKKEIISCSDDAVHCAKESSLQREQKTDLYCIYCIAVANGLKCG